VESCGEEDPLERAALDGGSVAEAYIQFAETGGNVRSGIISEFLYEHLFPQHRGAATEFQAALAASGIVAARRLALTGIERTLFDTTEDSARVLARLMNDADPEIVHEAHKVWREMQMEIAAYDRGFPLRRMIAKMHARRSVRESDAD
jgi:hypothetical protein